MDQPGHCAPPASLQPPLRLLLLLLFSLLGLLFLLLPGLKVSLLSSPSPLPPPPMRCQRCGLGIVGAPSQRPCLERLKTYGRRRGKRKGGPSASQPSSSERSVEGGRVRNPSFLSRSIALSRAAEGIVKTLGRDFRWRNITNDANVIIEVFGSDTLGRRPAYACPTHASGMDMSLRGHRVLDLGGHIGVGHSTWSWQ